MIRRPPRTTRTDTLSLHDALPICVGWRVDRVPRMGMERAGVTFASLMGLGPQTAVDTAKLAEEVGYSSFWTAETTGPEAFSRSEEHTSELKSLMRNSYAVFCLKKKTTCISTHMIPTNEFTH